MGLSLNKGLARVAERLSAGVSKCCAEACKGEKMRGIPEIEQDCGADSGLVKMLR